MKKYMKLLMFFLISVLICVLFFTYFSKIQELAGNKVKDNISTFENEILLKKYTENEKLTMIYLYKSINANDLEIDPFHNIMLTVSRTFPDTIENRIVDINSDVGVDIKKYLNITTEESFAVLIDKNGYALSVYNQPINQKTILSELTYASTYAN